MLTVALAHSLLYNADFVFMLKWRSRQYPVIEIAFWFCEKYGCG